MCSSAVGSCGPSLCHPQAGSNQVLASQCVSSQFGTDHAIMHDQNPVTQSQKFFIITAVKENGLALLGQAGEQRVEFCLGSNVHAFGWIIEQENLRVAHQ